MPKTNAQNSTRAPGRGRTGLIVSLVLGGVAGALLFLPWCTQQFVPNVVGRAPSGWICRSIVGISFHTSFFASEISEIPFPMRQVILQTVIGAFLGAICFLLAYEVRRLLIERRRTRQGRLSTS
jgi:uncharacterized membrane protein YeaQ/YmgE (transglycosylase-associated protein family)